MHRWYDSKTGRWISEDPIGFAAGDANLTRYVTNEILTSIDPRGLERKRAKDAIEDTYTYQFIEEVREDLDAHPVNVINVTSESNVVNLFFTGVRGAFLEMIPTGIDAAYSDAREQFREKIGGGNTFEKGVYSFGIGLSYCGQGFTNYAFDVARHYSAPGVETVENALHASETIVAAIDLVNKRNVTQGITTVLPPTERSWEEHKVRLYSDLKIHFGLDIPFRRKDENVRTLVANEYQKLIENRTLKYLGYERTAHEYYHFYEYGSYLYLFGADGKLVSRWSPVTEERAYNNIMKKLCKESE